MSLLPFWPLLVALLFMQGQKALGYHPKYTLICVLKMSEVLTRLERLDGWVINDRTLWGVETIPLCWLICFSLFHEYFMQWLSSVLIHESSVASKPDGRWKKRWSDLTNQRVKSADFEKNRNNDCPWIQPLDDGSTALLFRCSFVSTAFWNLLEISVTI